MTDAAITDSTTGEEVPSSRAPQFRLSEELMASPARYFNRETSWLAFNGGVCGFLIVLFRGQLPLTLARYGLMFKARAYLAPASHEVAGKPFPYSVAVLLGTLGCVYWMNFS